MEAKASARYVRVTPMKARRVVNLIRGKQAEEALAILKFAPQAASEPVYKIVASAMANARQKANQEGVAFREEELFYQRSIRGRGPDHEAHPAPRSGSCIPHQQAHQPHYRGRCYPRKGGEPLNGPENSPERFPTGHHHRTRL